MNESFVERFLLEQTIIIKTPHFEHEISNQYTNLNIGFFEKIFSVLLLTQWLIRNLATENKFY